MDVPNSGNPVGPGGPEGQHDGPVAPGAARWTPSDPPTATYVMPAGPVSTGSPIVVQKRGSSALGLLLGVAVVVAIGGVAFAAGRLTAPPTTTAATGGLRNGAGVGGSGAAGSTGTIGRGGFGGAGGLGAGVGNGALTVRGTVTAVSATSITLTLSTGGTLEVPIDGGTTYHSQATAAATDVQSGTEVLVELAGGFAGIGPAGANGGTGAAGSPPPPVGGSGAGAGSGAGPAGSAVPGAPGAAGGPRLGPARDITIVTP